MLLCTLDMPGESEVTIRFAPVPRDEILGAFFGPEQQAALNRYESVRPDVLHDRTQDIFAPNSRSTRHPTDFSLFQQTSPDEADVIVCQAWLEVAQHCRIGEWIPEMVQGVLDAYPNKPVVFSWNHDIDAANVSALRNLPERAVVLNYNTSQPTRNDLLLPFWNVEPNPKRAAKRYFAGFQGGMCKARNLFYRTLLNRPEYHISTIRLPEREYLELISSFWFSLCPRGGGLSSYRYFESIHCHSIPVLFGDAAVLPYPDLDYSEFAVRFQESTAGVFEFVDQRLRALDAAKMTAAVSKVAERFTLLGVQREVHKRLRGMLS